jgi:hypothetical protein
MRSGTGDLAANAVIFYGTVIARNAAGNVVPASDTAALKVLGIAQAAADNTGGAAGAKSVPYVTCVTAELDNAAGAIVQANKGGLCYAADDQSVTTLAVAVNDVVVGTVTKFTATKVHVFIDERANA